MTDTREPEVPLRQKYGTPQPFFDKQHAVHKFTIDLAADENNAKLNRYWSEDHDALSRSWTGERGWLNPPYRNVGKWVEKAFNETRHNGCELVVMLINYAPSTKYWHKYIQDETGKLICDELKPVKGRIKMIPPPGLILPKGNRPRYDSAIVIYRGKPSATRCKNKGFYCCPKAGSERGYEQIRPDGGGFHRCRCDCHG